ncbi:hypothetical protein [Chamaesiphon sp.]
MLARTLGAIAQNPHQSVRIEIFLYITTYLEWWMVDGGWWMVQDVKININ